MMSQNNQYPNANYENVNSQNAFHPNTFNQNFDNQKGIQDPGQQQFLPSENFEQHRIDVEEDNNEPAPIHHNFMAEETLADKRMSKNLTHKTRMGFIRKVFGIVAAMLTISCCFVIVPMYVPSVEWYLRDDSSLWLVIVCFVIT